MNVRQITLLDRFRAMVDMRSFEEACAEGVRTGEIHGEMHLAIGQEAVAAGMIGLLRDEDALASTHRPHLHALAKGVDKRALLAEIFEKASGICGGRGGHLHLFEPDCRFSSWSIVGASLPVALGYAYAARLRGTEAVAIGVTGDGGANNGVFHEALNMAGAWRLPLVVLIENNSWGISVAAADVTATPTFSERASAYAALGLHVDGADVLAVHEALAAAIGHARSGEGPALIEVLCQRFRGHYEGDTDHYRSKEAKAEMLLRDPILTARTALIQAGEATAEELDALTERSRREMADLLAAVRSESAPDPASAREFGFSWTPDAVTTRG